MHNSKAHFTFVTKAAVSITVIALSYFSTNLFDYILIETIIGTTYTRSVFLSHSQDIN